jgi:hypothetical protein
VDWLLHHHKFHFLAREFLIRSAITSRASVDFSGYTAAQKINALVRGIEGDKRWNTALGKAPTAEAMLDLLESASNKLKLGLSRQELATTPPLRDWLWFKKNKPLFTIGDELPRYRQQ